MDFLLRFVQVHETFRKPEIEALAVLANVNVEFLSYNENVGLQHSLFSTVKDFFWLPRTDYFSVVSILHRPTRG